jgi:hypothetical protein
MSRGYRLSTAVPHNEKARMAEASLFPLDSPTATTLRTERISLRFSDTPTNRL